MGKHKKKHKSKGKRDIADDFFDCFVATATYQDAFAPEVVVLRSYRDEVLQYNVFGRAFIRVYYRVGPVLAIPVKRSARLRSYAKACLDMITRRLDTQPARSGKRP